MTKEKNFILGAHTSASGGVYNALVEGQEIGATTIQLFTSNQRQWKGRPIDEESLEKWNLEKEKTGMTHLMSHASYLINLGSPHEEGLLKSREAFREEIERCQQLGITYLNFHPGAALDGGLDLCLTTIIESLLVMEPLFKKEGLRLLIEATAGQGSVVGSTFEEIGHIVDGVKGRLPIGVCIDTCHIFAAGYDIRTPEGWDKTLKQFDQVVGLEHLYAFHVNDSMKALGSHLDRHEPLGEGLIGWECFRFMMRDKRLSALPKYLETPGGPERWRIEIQKLKAFGADNA